MLKLYYTFDTIDSHEFLFRVVQRHYGIADRTLCFGEYGKPYFPHASVHFSLTHTHNLIAVAISDAPVGADAEFVKTTKTYESILRRLPEAEKKEIKTKTDFFTHWTIKESYIKLTGQTLASLYEKLSFVGGTLSLDEKKLGVKITSGTLHSNAYVYALCHQTETIAELYETDASARTLP